MNQRWHTKRRRLPIPLVVVLIAALVLPAHLAATTAPPGDEDVPRFEPAKCGFTPVKPQIEGSTVTCGYVVVPLHRRDPAGPTIRLAVARFTAAHEPRAAEPILYLQGGPGGGALNDATGTFAARFTDTHDFVIFDQRGVGQSQPVLDCPEADAQYRRNSTRPIGPAEEVTTLVEAYGRCHDRLARRYDLTAFTTAENAADVNDIRVALGYQKVNLLGASYGTLLALTVMRDFPQIVLSAVLDGVSPPGIDPSNDYVANFDRALSLLFDGCAADVACAASFPALPADFDRVVADLDAHPLPIVRTSGDDEDERLPDYLLTGTRFVTFMEQFLYAAGATRFLPLLITQLRDRDTTLLRLLFTPRSLLARGISEGAYWSVWCSDYAPFGDRTQALTAAGGVRPAVRAAFLPGASGEYDICARWGATSPRAIGNVAVASDIPTLVLTSANDPVTPPAYAQRAIQTLPRATYVESPGIGHTVIGNGGRCGAQIVRDFYANPNVPPDTRCVQNLAVPFLPQITRYAKPPPQAIDPAKRYTATLTTTEGTITLDLFADAAPAVVNSFVFLAGEGFFDGMEFYAIVQGYGIASGDPTETGQGGPGYTVRRDPIPARLDYERGMVVAANSGTERNGSRFVILSGDKRGDLERAYAIFGQVREGMDVVDRILTWHDAAVTEPQPRIVSVTVRAS